MNPDHKQSFLATLLALVTAFAAVVGAIGGLIATIYATDGGDPAATPAPSSAVFSQTPTATATPSPAPEVHRSTPTPTVVEIAPEADSWWGSPATSGDEGTDNRGEGEELFLSWGCSDDSRGNGSKRDCGSGTVALQFDLNDLPDGATVDEAVLRLYAADGSATGTKIYARRVTSGWAEDGQTPPNCDPSDEAAGAAAGDDWAWDVTTVVQDHHAGEENNVGFCLVFKEAAGVKFVSREGAESRAPALTTTYRRG